MTTNITNKKMYPAREALQFIPEIATEPSMRKFIDEDMKGRNLLQATVQKIGKHRRYFIPHTALEQFAA